MSPFVLDASVALAWLSGEEAAPAADTALRRLEHDEALVPHPWHLEVRNGLLVAARRGRCIAGSPVDRLKALSDLLISTDTEPDLDIAFALAERHGLSFYDAICLELAKRHAAPLATLGRALASAAATEGLSLVCDQ